MNVSFDKLAKSDLIVDAVYEGGTGNGYANDPLTKLLQVGTSGGFRAKLTSDKKKYAYVVLYTTMSELEWPDYLDVETGVLRYYGDNRKPGNDMLKTKKAGNKLLEHVFEILNSGKNLNEIPPFFVFRKGTKGRDVKFLGLAAPGNPNISPDKDLVAFWRTLGEKRFQNYESYFTILNTGEDNVSRKWIEKLVNDNENSINFAPKVWKEFIEKGRNGIKALKAPRIFSVPSKYEQLQSNEDGKKCLELIREHYKDNPTGFEACAVRIAEMMDNNFENFNLTRPWRDGGRDAIGYYSISTGNKANFPLKIDCALEAKCYGSSNSVGVKQMSRLISRIRYRQFGVLVTTSFVDKQAYREVVEDQHPILIVTASDIAYILNRNMIDSSKINDWLINVDSNVQRDCSYH